MRVVRASSRRRTLAEKTPHVSPQPPPCARLRPLPTGDGMEKNVGEKRTLPLHWSISSPSLEKTFFLVESPAKSPRPGHRPKLFRSRGVTESPPSPCRSTPATPPIPCGSLFQSFESRASCATRRMDPLFLLFHARRSRISP